MDRISDCGQPAAEMDFGKEIGRRIKKARDETGLSLVRLSKRLDGVLSASRIGNYEQGARLPGPQEALILGRALGVSPAYLMCLEGDEMSKEELQLLTDWRALPERDRKEYARRISALALVYKDAVPDERLEKFASPTSRTTPAKPKTR